MFVMFNSMGVISEVASQFDAFNEGCPVEGKKLRLRIGQTGAWNTIESVIAKLSAKHSKTLSATQKHYTQQQWTDRMTARGANAKVALSRARASRRTWPGIAMRRSFGTISITSVPTGPSALSSPKV